MAKKLTDKQKQWIGKIKEQRSQGLSKQEYCKRNGLNIHQFSYYHRFLQDQGQSESGFLTLKSKPNAHPITLILSSGIRIEIPDQHVDKLASIASQF
jgi:hypothetical protein